jgi:D-beta-D-heptose 7-phosphate kinase / D-beta-D-heptose 1-phosphate adenosyltransferase
MSNALKGVLPAHGFTTTSVLIIGDLMLDRYISGEVTRISPEAPVPVLSVTGEQAVAGGAANVALNVAGLRARTAIAGVVGADVAGKRLTAILDEKGMDLRGVLTDEHRPTTCKTRVVSGNHQIVRLDEEVIEDLSLTVSCQLFERVQWILSEGVDTVVLSDYGKGVLAAEFTQRVIQECRTRGIPVLVDPKRVDYTPYAHATCITPNQKEFKAAISGMGITGQDLLTAGRQLREIVDCGTLLVTRGAQGMTLITSEHAHHFPALAQEVYDVSGAGDTVIAVLATALAHGLDLVSAVHLANAAASIVVRHAGTSPIRWESLLDLVCAKTAQDAHSIQHTTVASSLPAFSSHATAS